MSKREINQWTLELWCLNSSISLEKSKGVFSVRRTVLFIEQKRRNRRMGWFIAINSQDEASFDQNSAIKSRPFDR